MDYIKYIFLEKFSEVFSCHTNVNIIIHLYCNTYTVALSYTEAAGEHNVILDMIVTHCFLEELYNILRALEMTGRAYANLYKQHLSLPLRELRS